MQGIEIRIDRGTCRGARACVRRAPGSFSLDAEGKSVAAAQPADDETAIREAASACPFFAITVLEAPLAS